MSDDSKNTLTCDLNELKPLNPLDLIIQAIYDNDRFSDITQRYVAIFKLKEKKTTEEVLMKYVDFVYETISNKLKGNTGISGIKKIRENHAKNIWSLKKRWLTMTMNSLENDTLELLKKEYSEASIEYIKYGTVLGGKYSTPDELLADRKQFLQAWSSSIEYTVCSYPYLEELSTKKINSAFTHDLMFCVADVLREEYDYDIDKIMVKSPSNLAPGLFDPQTRGRRSSDGVSRSSDTVYMSNSYDAISPHGSYVDLFYEFDIENPRTHSDNIATIAGLKLELVNQETEQKALRKLYLDKNDLAIIRYVYMYSHVNKFKFLVSDLLKYLRLTDSKKNYTNIENKLIKLPFYTFYAEQPSENGGDPTRTSFNLFSRTHITTNSQGRREVEITKAFVEEVERASMEIMYRKELKKLKLIQSENLAYCLENKRSYEIGCGNDVKNKKYSFSIDSLKWYVHLNNKKSLKYNMEYLEEGFKEIVSNQFIIKKYEIEGTTFNVWFYEDIEKRKCLIRNTVLSLPDNLINS